MLAVVDRQAEVADGKIKSRDYRGAITLLRRTYNLALAHRTAAPPNETPLVVTVAASCVQVQLCCALSRIGRHGPALQEAIRAKDCTESSGDMRKPHPALRSHIVNPPCWLERAICCGIQSRLCIAMEMEFLLSKEEMQSQHSQLLWSLRSASHTTSQVTIATATSMVGFPSGGLPSEDDVEGEEIEALEGEQEELPPSFSEMQQIHQLYSEALELASQLLPNGHAVALDAQNAQRCAMKRWEEVSEAKGRQRPKPLSGFPHRSVTMPALQSALSPQDPTVEAVAVRRNTDSVSHGDWVKRAPPGDVFYRSLPWSFGIKSPKKGRKKKKAENIGISSEPSEADPFKDWAKEFMHLENMTLFQRKLRTLDGLSSLHTDMKIETKRFRQFMQDLEMYGETQNAADSGGVWTVYRPAGPGAFGQQSNPLQRCRDEGVEDRPAAERAAAKQGLEDLSLRADVYGPREAPRTTERSSQALVPVLSFTEDREKFEQIVTFLGSVPLFKKQLPTSELPKVAQMLEETTWAPDAKLVSQGAQSCPH
eukprot:g8837.t1